MSQEPLVDQLWFTPDHSRFFLVPQAWEPVCGSFQITNVDRCVATVDEQCLEPFELPEEQARRWMLEVLGQSLESIRRNIDGELNELRRRIAAYKETPVSPNTGLKPRTVPAMVELLTTMPGVIGNSLSGDADRVASAKTSMTLLKQRLVDAGIDLDSRFTDFPSRLAQLRADFDARRRK